MTIFDQIEIAELAHRAGCHASFPETGDQLQSDAEIPEDVYATRLLAPLKQTADYPAELLAARREGFVRQIEQYNTKSDGLWNPNVVEGESRVSDWHDERNSKPIV